MGMYDSVWVSCPKCDRGIEVQSRAGDCLLKDYRDEAPPSIATSINGEIVYCEQCKRGYRIMALQKSMVAIIAVPIDVSVGPFEHKEDYRN